MSLSFPVAFGDRKAVSTLHEVLGGKGRCSKTDLVGPLIHKKDKSFRILIRFLIILGGRAGYSFDLFLDLYFK